MPCGKTGVRRLTESCEPFEPFLFYSSVFHAMRVIIAPDKFKGCLSAEDAAAAMAAGVLRAMPSASVDLCPMADGGEGTVEALVNATRGRLISRRVTGPLPEMKVEARFGILGDGATAV